MSKFEDYFSEPQYFSDCSYVVSGELSAEIAAEMISEDLGEVITASELTLDRVRYGFAPEHIEDMDGEACWYTGAGIGKGTKPVWVYT
tara:strand:+ start:52 stop:315 length:264 start_codon:yes stop_codon:yes gene_type:complete